MAGAYNPKQHQRTSQIAQLYAEGSLMEVQTLSSNSLCSFGDFSVARVELVLDLLWKFLEQIFRKDTE